MNHPASLSNPSSKSANVPSMSGGAPSHCPKKLTTFQDIMYHSLAPFISFEAVFCLLSFAVHDERRTPQACLEL